MRPGSPLLTYCDVGADFVAHPTPRRCSYTSPSLSFYLITPEIAPTTFYDQSLSIHPTSLDLPVLRLYRGGKVLAQLPKSGAEVRADRKKGRMEKRKLKEVERRKARAHAEKEESESGSETDESEDEREAEQEVNLARYKWDRTAVRSSGRDLCATRADFRRLPRRGLSRRRSSCLSGLVSRVPLPIRARVAFGSSRLCQSALQDAARRWLGNGCL